MNSLTSEYMYFVSVCLRSCVFSIHMKKKRARQSDNLEISQFENKYVLSLAIQKNIYHILKGSF